MAQRSGLWDGIVGDGGPYGSADLHDWFLRMVLNGTGNRGPLKWWLDGLEPSGVSSPISVASGAGIVYGQFYETDAALSLSIPTPSAGLSRYDYAVLRRDWSVQTIRLARVAGVAAAAPAPPALTQSPGAIYEVPLATVLIDDAGAIDLADAREFCKFSTAWPANSVDTEHYVPGAVTPAKVPDRTRWDGKGGGSIVPDSAAPCTWVAGANYDYYSFADLALNSCWVYFMPYEGMVSAQVDIQVWSVPDVNGGGGGVENCRWDYNAYTAEAGGLSVLANGTVNVDQQFRVNTTFYRDTLIAAHAVNPGDIIMLQLSRAGAPDSYNNAMRLLAVEMAWTADA